MADCDICKIMENKKEFKIIYEDDVCIALLHESPSVPGHTLLFPKEHFPILEEIPDKITEHLFVVANKISMLLFELLKATGTNIIINNGTDAGQELPHFLINIIPRKEKDNLNFEWAPKKKGEDELKTTLSMIKTFSDGIFKGEEYKRVKIKAQDSKEDEKEEDYLIKQLKRIP
ncbi:HIT family protein [Candidatus Woesearchaeota archaeon]|nr:HIT family protein [Candidatus Woesearchaeota archaeon]